MTTGRPRGGLHDLLAIAILGACVAMASAQEPCDEAIREPSALDLRPTAPPLLVSVSAPGELQLSWEDTRAEYVLSRGSLLTLRTAGYDHSPLECELGTNAATVADEAGSFYYLVAARSGTMESSHGRNSLSQERPRPEPPCAQLVFGCPGDGLRRESPLPGACITFATPESTFTLAEAATGVEIEYAVVIDADIGGVTPLDRHCDCCNGISSPSGLRLEEVLSGSGQRYCVCDTGPICDCVPFTRTIDQGTHPQTFQWLGRNGEAPSDPGPPFPPGVYLLEVTAVGYWEEAPGGPQSFTVAGTHLVILVP